jgi:hypothetical protein
MSFMAGSPKRSLFHLMQYDIRTDLAISVLASDLTFQIAKRVPHDVLMECRQCVLQMSRHACDGAHRTPLHV